MACAPRPESGRARDAGTNQGVRFDVFGALVDRKPTPHSYLRTAELLSLQLREVCMTAAHNDDRQAARACGLRTAFIYRRKEYGPEQRADLQPAADRGFIAESITDLAAQAGCA